MKRFVAKEPAPANVAAEDWEAENQACANLQSSMMKIMSGEKVDKHVAWDRCWMDVYGLADIIMARTMKSFMSTI